MPWLKKIEKNHKKLWKLGQHLCSVLKAIVKIFYFKYDKLVYKILETPLHNYKINT